MFKLLIALLLSYKNLISRKAANAAGAWQDRETPEFLRELGLMCLAIFAPVVGMMVLLLVAYQLRKALLLLVMILILFASYRANHPEKMENTAPSGKVDAELARQRAKELYPCVRDWMFRVLVAVSSFTIIDQKHDVREIETASISGEHFYMDGTIPVYQFEFDLDNEVTQEQADDLRDKLQEYGQKYIKEYPMLVHPDSAGRSAMEVLTVHPLGHRVCIDVVQTAVASISMIEDRRRARAERKNAPKKPPRYTEQDYWDKAGSEMEPITFCAERLPSGGAIRPIKVDFDKFPHIICQGGTGTGKSMVSLLITAKISRLSGSQVFILDYKNDVDMFKFCHGKNCRYWRFRDCEAGLEEYYDLLQAELESGEDSGPPPVRWLWIDELGSWLLNSDKKTADSIRAKIATILMVGRSRRFFVQTSVQRAQAELFSIGSRDNYNVCLSMGNASKEAASVLGFSRDEFLPVTEIGGGHLIVGGQQYPVQVPYIGLQGMERMKEDILKAITRTTVDEEIKR